MASDLTDGFGLNKLARLRAEAAARDKKQDSPRLESDFPWPERLLGFDDRFFRADPSDWPEDDDG